MEEIFNLIFDERVDTNTKDILSDSIKLILIKSTSELRVTQTRRPKRPCGTTS